MSVGVSPTVLVVDDEPIVRSVMVAALRDHYRGVAAADGLEALDVFRAAEDEITRAGTRSLLRSFRSRSTPRRC